MDEIIKLKNIYLEVDCYDFAIAIELTPKLVCSRIRKTGHK